MSCSKVRQGNLKVGLESCGSLVGTGSWSLRALKPQLSSKVPGTGPSREEPDPPSTYPPSSRISSPVLADDGVSGLQYAFADLTQPEQLSQFCELVN